VKRQNGRTIAQRLRWGASWRETLTLNAKAEEKALGGRGGGGFAGRLDFEGIRLFSGKRLEMDCNRQPRKKRQKGERRRRNLLSKRKLYREGDTPFPNSKRGEARKPGTGECEFPRGDWRKKTIPVEVSSCDKEKRFSENSKGSGRES